MIDLKSHRIQDMCVKEFNLGHRNRETFSIEVYDKKIQTNRHIFVVTPPGFLLDWSDYHTEHNVDIDIDAYFLAEANPFDISPEEQKEINRHNVLTVGFVKDGTDIIKLNDCCDLLNEVIQRDWLEQFKHFRYNTVSDKIIIFHSIGK